MPRSASARCSPARQSIWRADGVIAWHCRAADGKLDFSLGEIDDADIKNVADYQTILPFARMRIDEQTRPTYEKMAAEAASSGKLNRVGDHAKISAGRVRAAQRAGGYHRLADLAFLIGPIRFAQLGLQHFA